MEAAAGKRNRPNALRSYMLDPAPRGPRHAPSFQASGVFRLAGWERASEGHNRGA